MAREIEPIHTKRTIVRLADEPDVGAILRYYEENQRHLGPWEPARPPGFYTRPFWTSQVRRSRRDYEEDRAVRLFIFDRHEPNTIIGYISLTNITRGAAHFCYVGYSLSLDCQGRGLMTEALRATIDFAFGPLGLHRIMANYMPHNTRSASLLKRLGFTVEGYARDYLLINGQWEDHILTSLVNTRWTPQTG